VGLDINTEGFKKNVSRLKENGGYYGRVNIATGEYDDYQLQHILSFEEVSEYMKNYFEHAEKVLVLEPKDFDNPKKMKSHTATVSYHALKGHYGIQRTYVPWEPTLPDESRGVLVSPDHGWMYFFSATAVEDLKNELNNAAPKL